ncbi:MAG: glycosyltransferase family 87 protein [Terriglobales bacterium]
MSQSVPLTQMGLRQRYVAAIAFLILLGSGFYRFGMLLPEVRASLVRRNLGGGYGFSNDLYPIWMGSGELFHGRNPYAPGLTPRIETGLYGRPLDRSTPNDASVNLRAFAYPLYTIFLFAPLAPLSFPAVQVVMSVLLPCLAAITVILWLRVLGATLSASGFATTICLTLASYPVLEGIYAGQPGMIAIALISGTVTALARERYALAGILLPCASIKPQLILLLALWLTLWALSDWNRRRNFLVTFTATTALLLASSTWVMPSWFSGWMHALREYRQISPPPLAQFVLSRYPGIGLSLFLLALSAALCWRKRHEPAQSEGFALATVFLLATTAIIFPSTIAVYDQFLLLPAALWLYTRRHRILSASRPLRALALLALGTLAWQWISACALVLTHWLFPAAAHKLLLMPLRTAASLPFAFAALLGFVVFREMKDEVRPVLEPHAQT